MCGGAVACEPQMLGLCGGISFHSEFNFNLDLDFEAISSYSPHLTSHTPLPPTISRGYI